MLLHFNASSHFQYAISGTTTTPIFDIESMILNMNSVYESFKLIYYNEQIKGAILN